MQHILVFIAGAGLAAQALIYAVALIGASVHYRGRARARAEALSWRGWLRHLCPPALLASRWTYADTLFYLADRGLGIVLYPATTLLAVSCAALVQSALRACFGQGPGLPLDGLALGAFLAVGLVVRDFVSFALHMMQHRIPLLWEFHKVHHAPESLVPLTGHRLHPLELCVNLVGDAPVLGLLAGVYAWLGDGGLAVLVTCAAGLQLVVGLLTLAPLRHSHIDLRFGRLEWLLLSPAHHQLHHSVEPAHWDKNFSAIFPFWDRAWRTLLPPPPAGSYQLGLPGGESAAHVSLLATYAGPFRSAVRRGRAGGWAGMMRVGKLGER